MEVDGVSGWVPESCSLPRVERPLRVAEFDGLFGDSVLRSTRVNRTRLELALASDAATIARDLAEREAGCCSFFSFEFASAGSSVVMGIAVPESHAEVLDALTARVRAVAGGSR